MPFALSLEPALGPDELAACDWAAVELTDYFRALVAQRRRSPTGDLTSALAAIDDLTEDDLLGLLVLLFAAGFETTTQLLATSVVALAGRPDQLERWRGDPALTSSAVEELLRFDSPVQLNSRVLHRDVTADGVEIPAGRVVFNFLGAANRDPAQFAEPDRLDLGRLGVRSMSSAAGRTSASALRSRASRSPRRCHCCSTRSTSTWACRNPARGSQCTGSRGFPWASLPGPEAPGQPLST